MDGMAPFDVVVVAIAAVAIVSSIFLRVRARRETRDSVWEVAVGKTDSKGDITMRCEVRAPVGFAIKGELEERSEMAAAPKAGRSR